MRSWILQRRNSAGQHAGSSACGSEAAEPSASVNRRDCRVGPGNCCGRKNLNAIVSLAGLPGLAARRARPLLHSGGSDRRSGRRTRTRTRTRGPRDGGHALNSEPQRAEVNVTFVVGSLGIYRMLVTSRHRKMPEGGSHRMSAWLACGVKGGCYEISIWSPRTGS
jgi:hypothetical protein